VYIHVYRTWDQAQKRSRIRFGHPSVKTVDCYHGCHPWRRNFKSIRVRTLPEFNDQYEWGNVPQPRSRRQRPWRNVLRWHLRQTEKEFQEFMSDSEDIWMEQMANQSVQLMEIPVNRIRINTYETKQKKRRIIRECALSNVYSYDEMFCSGL